MNKVFFFILIIVFLGFHLQGQTSHSLLRSADKLYEKEDFQGAEETYRKAVEDKTSANGEYNLGNSIFQQNRFEEALNHYEQAASLSADPNVKSDAYYNLGNTYMNMQEFEKGVEAYKNALRNNPNDEDSKYNLSVAQQIVKQMQQQQQQEKQQQESQESDENQEEQEQNQEQQESQEQNEQQEGGEEQQQEKEQEQKEGEEQKEEKEPQAGEEDEKKELNNEDAARLLRIAEEEEKATQQKLRKVDSKQKKISKDW